MGGRTYHVAAGVVAFAFYELLGLILYTLLLRGLPRWSWVGPALAAGLAVALLLVTPVALLVFADGLRYMGYVGINVWHNPTMVLLKPLAACCYSSP